MPQKLVRYRDRLGRFTSPESLSNPPVSTEIVGAGGKSIFRVGRKLSPKTAVRQARRISTRREIALDKFMRSVGWIRIQFGDEFNLFDERMVMYKGDEEFEVDFEDDSEFEMTLILVFDEQFEPCSCSKRGKTVTSCRKCGRRIVSRRFQPGEGSTRDMALFTIREIRSQLNQGKKTAWGIVRGGGLSSGVLKKKEISLERGIIYYGGLEIGPAKDF